MELASPGKSRATELLFLEKSGSKVQSFLILKSWQELKTRKKALALLTATRAWNLWSCDITEGGIERQRKYMLSLINTQFLL